MISVVICTCNRAASLRRTLESMSRIAPPAGGFEVVIVDNHSSDSTSDIVRAYSQSPLAIRYIFEPVPGLSRARNRGGRAARGEIVAFTDDDTIISENWLVEIEKAFLTFPDATLVGGKVLPHWEAQRPKWLASDLLWMLALLDYGQRPTRLNSPSLFGANFACAAHALVRPDPFDVRLGRRGSDLRGGEETAFQRDVLSLGGRLYYIPDMVIHHVIPADRLTRRHFAKLAFQMGVGTAYLGVYRGASLGLARRVGHSLGLVLKSCLRGHASAATLRSIYYVGIIGGLGLRALAPFSRPTPPGSGGVKPLDAPSPAHIHDAVPPLSDRQKAT